MVHPRAKREEPKRPAAPALATAAAGGALGRALLFVHLALSPLVFSKETIEVFEYNKVNLLLAAAIALLALLAARLLRDGTGPFRDGARDALRDPAALGFALFLVSAALSTASSISPWTSIFGCHESFSGIFTILAYTVLFFGTRELVGTAADARRLLLATAIAAAVASTYAIVQVAQIDPIRWGRVSTFGGFVRPFATMGHPNFLSAFLAMAFPVVAYLGARAARRGDWLSAAAFAAIAVFSIVGIGVSVSRGAWLAFAAAYLVLVVGWALVRERRGLAALLFLIPAGAIAFLVICWRAPGGEGLIDGIVHRIQEFASSQSRIHIWRATWDLFIDHPLLGCGLDGYQLAFEQKRTVAYWLVEWNGTPTKAHNEALHILATQGIVGGIATLIMTGGIFVMARRALRRAGEEEKSLLVAGVAALVAFYVQDVFSFTVAGCGTLFVTLAAIASALGRGDAAAAARAEPSDRRAPFAATLVAAALLGLVLFFLNVSDRRGDEPPAEGRALAGLAMILAFAVPIAAVLRTERSDAPDLAAPAPPRPGSGSGPGAGPSGADLARGAAVAAAAIAVAWLGVVRPMQANWACRDGSDLAQDATRYAGLLPARTLERYAAALASLERAVEIDPTKEIYWVKLGNALHMAARATSDPAERRRRFARAREAIEESIRLVPANSYNWANLARALTDMARERLAKPEDAFAAFDRALELDPNNAYFLADAANAGIVLGDVAQARKYAERGAALYGEQTYDAGKGPVRYPGYGPLLSQLGIVALLEQREEEAEEHLRAALEGEWKGDEASFALAATYLTEQLGRPELTLRATKAAKEHDPWFAAPYSAAGEALEKLGRKAEAIAEYREALERNPINEEAQRALARLGARR